jgi:hypothetical protein
VEKPLSFLESIISKLKSLALATTANIRVSSDFRQLTKRTIIYLFCNFSYDTYINLPRDVLLLGIRYSFFLSGVSDSCIWANNFLPAGPRVGAGRESREHYLALIIGAYLSDDSSFPFFDFMRGIYYLKNAFFYFFLT